MLQSLYTSSNIQLTDTYPIDIFSIFNFSPAPHIFCAPVFLRALWPHTLWIWPPEKNSPLVFLPLSSSLLSLLFLHTLRGLGKTLQSISFVAHIAHTARLPGPHLVVVPLSVLFNWISEFKKFCPSLKVLRLHSNDKGGLIYSNSSYHHHSYPNHFLGVFNITLSLHPPYPFHRRTSPVERASEWSQKDSSGRYHLWHTEKRPLETLFTQVRIAFCLISCKSLLIQCSYIMVPSVPLICCL